jgi:hypothetical protein
MLPGVTCAILVRKLDEPGVKCAIRIPANEHLERDIAEFLTRPMGRPSDTMRRKTIDKGVIGCILNAVWNL